MKNLIKIVCIEDASLIYLFKYFMIGVIHKNESENVLGFVFGIWRFQTQLTIGYSDQLEHIDEVYDA